MRIGWVAVLLFVGACQNFNCSGVSVCQPTCQANQTCDLRNGMCLPLKCEKATDCGPPRFYGCSDGHCQLLGCHDNSDCQDPSFCNGEERCLPGPDADSNGCVPPAALACPGPNQICDEAQNLCLGTCSDDKDGDHFVSTACGGADCDDNDAHRFPGNPEVCDSMGHDEDCDPTTFGVTDQDGDGFVSSACCNKSICGNDCDDVRRDVHPGATEVCNGLDDDCDTSIDYEVQLVAYPDTDHDGYGAADGGAVRMCDWQMGDNFSLYNNDCNDQNPAITPGAMVCTGASAPNQVQICNSDGVWDTSKCSGALACVTQPNGTGVCE